MPVIVPVSAGKVKQLWDAVRDTSTDGDPSAAGPEYGDAGIGGVKRLNSAVAASPDPTAPAPLTQPPPSSGGLTDDLLPAPRYQDTPGDQRVQAAQSQVDDANRKPTLLQRLGRAAIPLATAGIGALTHSPALIQGEEQGQEANYQAEMARRDSLTKQLQSAQTERAAEYDAAQRATQAANSSIIMGRSRMGVAGTAADARRDVADTGADARRYAADKGVEGRQIGADATGYAARTRLEGTRYTADQGVAKGKYAADAAANRQSRSIGAGFERQDRSLQNSLDKPNASEENRMDLSAAFKEYATQLKDIATRRPELFGRMAGTKPGLAARKFANPDDADVAALARIKENLGTVSLATHTLRNATHIQTAADKAADTSMNAGAFIKNLDDSVKSIDTFSNVHRPTVVTGQGRQPLASRVRQPSPSSSGSGPEPDLIYDPAKGLVPNPKARR